MTVRITLQLDKANIDRSLQKLDRYRQVIYHIDKIAADQMDKEAISIAERARVYAPKRTGLLAASIGVRHNPLQIVAEQPYSIFQEQGTRYMPGKWFMRRATREVMALAGAHMTIVLEEAIRRATV